jgi:CRP-like cAMP-binding protein
MHLLSHTAFGYGVLIAAALPLGAIASMIWRPKKIMVATLIAFGAGALIAALTLEVVSESIKKGEFYPLATGAITGGLLFVLLNQLVNNRGGFLRKAATTVEYITRKKIQQSKFLLGKLSQVRLFHELPAEEIQALVPYVASRTYAKGSTVIRQGDPGDSLFIIESGEVDIVDERSASPRIATLKAGEVFGEMALLTGEPRSASAVAASECRVWLVLKEHFDQLLKNSSVLARAVQTLVKERIHDLKLKTAIDPAEAEAWEQKAARNIEALATAPTEMDIREAAREHHGAALAVWLGILLDTIPKSLVIGSSLVHGVPSLSIFGGLFLSSFPEALSSSVGMRQQGYSRWKIFWMWAPLVLVTGIGAHLGRIFFSESPHFLFSLLEGIAVGAMLTMVTETEFPEAFEKGGAITGICTLLGFLAAVFLKTLGEGHAAPHGH